ncbi:MAG: peptidylprolyl isomerase [Bacteroidetes bacterium CG2_30_32_10]|nr:MAG: peptidylprolyl isomerase [Bacteroidetes bacterium CG2_30_32_10]
MKKLIFLLTALVILGITFSFVSKKEATNKLVLISTSFGDIKIKLYDETPNHRDNFIKLATEGYLNGTLFHRVIKNFMIQGGDPDSKNAKPGQMLGNGGPAYNIPAEFVTKYFHKKGALAAAREGDAVNPNKESSGSQFYIVQGRNYDDATLDAIEKSINKKFTTEQRQIYKTIGGAAHLDGNYTVFGEVIEGIEVVDKIANVAVDGNSRPLEDIKMTVKVVEK